MKGSEELYAHKWLLTELNGRPVTATGSEADAHLLFFSGQVSRVSGSTGCNRLNGTFELMSTHKIKFSPLATTRKLCPGANVESEFVAALGRVDTYSLVDNRLLLNSGRVTVARLTVTSN